MPFKSQLHVDQLLSQVSVKYRNAEFIAMEIFPEIPVKKDTDLYRIYTPDFRLPQTLKANKGIAREHYFEVSTSSYSLRDHAIKDYITDDDQDNYDVADLRADTTEELTDVIMRRVEHSVFSLFTTTNWSLNVSLAATGAWTADTTASNPIPVVDTGTSVVLQNSGLKPNFMVVGRDAFVGLKNHQSILDRYKYTQSAIMTEQLLANLFGVDQLLVANAQLDTSERGLTTSVGQMWGDVAFLGYKPPRPTPKAPSCGYIFRKNVPMVRRWRDEERNAEAIEVRVKFDARIVASLAGYLIKDVV
jgi:hypothetical protein